MSAPVGKVLVSGWPLLTAAEGVLKDNGFQIFGTSPAPDQAELVAVLREVKPDALIVRTGMIGLACFDAAPGLKVIANHGAGYDDIDVMEATRRRIPVFAAPGRNAISVAEHVFALLLAVRKRLLFHDDLVRTGQWRPAAPVTSELFGTTFGLVGLGAIGERTANLAQAFGMQVVAYDPGRTRPWPEPVHRCESLEQLLSRSDVVSLHVPLTTQTKHLIDAKAISQMKPGAILINAARGGVVDEGALAAALDSCHLSGAGFDTFAVEPPGQQASIVQNDRIVLSPHIAGVTPECTLRMSMCCASNVSDFLLAGQTGPDLVNPGIVEKHGSSVDVPSNSPNHLNNDTPLKAMK